ncbi:copper chaperone PCu(A)C [Advenella sp. RU8]|uniref:copper chaperone PCu(A)C n=1 Tax=Advenella sp. RU8 TaxID=3399575 RepID=UPI003AAEA8A7
MKTPVKVLKIFIPVLLVAGFSWWAVDYFKEPEYEWIEICTLEGVKRVKYDDQGNLLAEEWISRIPAHLALAEANQEAVQTQAPEAKLVELDAVEIDRCWIRLLPGNLPAAGYFELKNNSGKALVLSAIKSPAYASAIMHENIKKQGMTSMESLSQLSIPGNGTLSFSVNTYHIMLEKKQVDLKPGDFISLQFYFQDAGTKTVQCKVNSPNALDY